MDSVEGKEAEEAEGHEGSHPHPLQQEPSGWRSRKGLDPQTLSAAQV